MIIANLQVKLTHNQHNAYNSKLTYNLSEARTSDEILSENDLNNLRNWNIDTPPNETNLFWQNLKTGILKTLELK